MEYLDIAFEILTDFFFQQYKLYGGYDLATSTRREYSFPKDRQRIYDLSDLEIGGGRCSWGALMLSFRRLVCSFVSNSIQQT